MFDQSVADNVLRLLVESDDSLRTICKNVGLRMGSFLEWANESPAFAEQYARARAIKLDLMAEEVPEIADTPQLGIKTKINERGEVETTEGDMIEHRRLRIDARKWYLGKLAPKKYGDKLDLNHSGEIRVVKATELTSQEERDAAWKPPTR